MKIKNCINIFGLIILLNSCGKEQKTNNDKNAYENMDSYQIETTKQNVKTIDGIELNEKTELEIQLYKSISEKTIPNQVKFFKNQKIDSLKSHFYNLTYKKINENKFKGNIVLVYNQEKIIEIEFKAITVNHKKNNILIFKSDNSNSVFFEFENMETDSPIKGVLSIKIETEVLIEGKNVKGYLQKYMFVDSNTITDNLFINKYKNNF